MRALAPSLILAILAAVLSACTPPLRMESAWQPGARPARPYGNVLVVGVAQSFDRRQFFERGAVDELTKLGVQASASTGRMTTKDVLERDAVVAQVKAAGADAVLVTRIVNQDLDLKRERGRVLVKPEETVGLGESYDPSVYTLYRYDFSVSAEPSRIVVDRGASVRSEVFDAATGRVVYAIDSRVTVSDAEGRSLGSDIAVVDRVGRALADRLARDGVIARQR